MYDNIDLRLSKDRANCDFLVEMPNYLNNVNETYFSGGGISLTGYLDTLKVRVNENNVKIVDSSFCKYWLGDNIKGMFRGDMQRAIEKISDSLHLPFDKATATRIDVAYNFVTKHKESLYYPYLGQAQYYSRSEANNGLYYNNGKRQILFYGKLYEQQVKGNDIPFYYQSKNMLRYELRYRKRLPKQFNKPEITGSLLYDEVFYMDILKRWKTEYFKINKVNSILSNMNPTGSTKEFFDYLALVGLAEIGNSNVYKIIKEWQEKGEISRKQASDLRRKLKDLSTKPDLTFQNDMIKEIDLKVLEAVLHYR